MDIVNVLWAVIFANEINRQVSLAALPEPVEQNRDHLLI